MKSEKIYSTFIITILSVVSIYTYFFMMKEGMTNLALFELYSSRLGIDLIFNIYINSILFLPLLPLYFLINKYKNFSCLVVLSTLLFVIHTPWLLFTTFLFLLYFLSRSKEESQTFLVLTGGYLLSKLFIIDINVFLLIAVFSYLFFLKKSFLIDFLIAMFIVNIQYQLENFLIYHLVIFSLYYLKTLLVDYKVDIERPVILSVMITSMYFEIGAFALLYLLLCDYEKKNSKTILNYPINILIFSSLILFVKTDVNYLLFLSATLILCVFSDRKALHNAW